MVIYFWVNETWLLKKKLQQKPSGRRHLGDNNSCSSTCTGELMKKKCTSTVPHAQIWKSPKVAKADCVTKQRKNKIQSAGPFFSFCQLCIRTARIALCFTFINIKGLKFWNKVVANDIKNIILIDRIFSRNKTQMFYH